MVHRICFEPDFFSLNVFCISVGSLTRLGCSVKGSSVSKRCLVSMSAVPYSRGYFDVVDSQFVSEPPTRWTACPEDTLPMYLESVERDGAEHWRCAQIYCNASQVKKPA